MWTYTNSFGIIFFIWTLDAKKGCLDLLCQSKKLIKTINSFCARGLGFHLYKFCTKTFIIFILYLFRVPNRFLYLFFLCIPNSVFAQWFIILLLNIFMDISKFYFEFFMVKKESKVLLVAFCFCSLCIFFAFFIYLGEFKQKINLLFLFDFELFGVIHSGFYENGDNNNKQVT
jgi:hypothetical protein